MLRLMLFLVLLIASVWAGVEIMRHPGFLLIVYQPWMIQMPIWFVVLSGLVILILFYLLIDSIDRFQFLWFRLKNWLRFRQEHQSYSKTQQGYSALLEGKYKKAESLLLAGVNQTVEPLINYIGASKAAHELQAYDRRDTYIQKAYQIAPHAKLAIGLTQAELEISQRQFEQAVATLNHLRQLAPNHPQILKLLEKIYVRLGEWENLLGLAIPLRKANVLTHTEMDLFEKNLYGELLRNANPKNLQDIQEIWRRIPRGYKNNPDLVYAYILQLRRFSSSSKEIEDLIRKTLKYHWHAGLVEVYGTLHFTNLNRQLVVVGAWLKMYGPRPALLLLLGKLCVRVQLWGKAKDYFEKCLAQGPNPEASLEYGKLLEHLDELDEAMQKYRDGLAQLVQHPAQLLRS